MRRFLIAIGLLALPSCGDEIIDHPHRVASFNEAGTVNISLLPASNFRGGFGTGANATSLADAMKPNFNLSNTDAVNKAVPTTSIVEESLLDALIAKASIATPGATLPGSSSSSSNSSKTSSTTNSGSNPSVVTVTPPAVNVTVNLPNPPAATPPAAGNANQNQGQNKGGGQDGTGNKPTTTDKPKPALPIDPIYQYSVATALYQHTRLIDALIDAIAKAENYKVFLVPVNVNLKSFARNQPYDAYVTISFFVGKSDTPIDPVFAIPLLVTDDSEGVQTTQTLQILTQVEFALSAIVSGFTGSLDINKVRQQMRSIQATELNSLLTVGRATDNALSVRIGSQRTGSGYGMVSRNTTIYSLLLVKPDAQLDPETRELILRTVSKSTLRDAETGVALKFDLKNRIADYKALAERLFSDNKACHDALMANNADALDNIRGDVQQQDFIRARNDLPKECKDAKGNFALETTLWTAVAEIAGKSEFQSASLRISPSVQANVFVPAANRGSNRPPQRQ